MLHLGTPSPRWITVLAVIATGLGANAMASDAINSMIDSAASQKAIAAFVHGVLVSEVPRAHEDRENWDNTVKLFAGIKFERKDGKLRITDRKKDVPHGVWKRYRVTIADPTRDISVRIENLAHHPGGKSTFTLVVETQAKGWGEIKQFSNGIKLYAIDGEAKSTIELFLDCEIAASFTKAAFLPDLILKPRVTAARFHLKSFHLERVGGIDGPMARDLGDGMRGMIRKLLREQEPKIVAAADKAIAKHAPGGEIKISPSSAVRSAISSASK